MKIKKIDKYKELVELMPAIQDASIKGLKRDFQTYEFDVRRMKNKLRLFSDLLSILQGKWTIEICYILLIHGECSFNELKRDIPEISSRTFTDRLRTLEKNNIIARRVNTTKQIRVYYQLTEFGKQEIACFVPALLNFILPKAIRKDFPKIEAFRDTYQQEINKKEESTIELLEN